MVVDGTKSGPTCSSAAADQDRGPIGPGGAWGRNGIEVFEASGVTIQNLTACNFLSGQGGSGNEIWWNGGAETAQIHLHSYSGSYLSATTAYYQPSDPAQATYGIFVSNSAGPGLIDRTYASNMNDSGYYIGACPDCNAVLDHAHGENNVLGYSGTNSGGHLVISNGEWNDNGEGIDTNSASDGDLPAPQNGACPARPGSCFSIVGNNIHDNNNRDVPGNGLGLVGAGVVVAGGRNDTIQHNRFAKNGAWAVALVPYISGIDHSPADCTDAGGVWDNPLVDTIGGGPSCFFLDYGSNVHDNFFVGNGSFANPSNGDLADLSDFSAIGIPAAAPGQGNCWHGNVDPAGVTSAPTNLQTTNGNCATAAGAPASVTRSSARCCATFTSSSPATRCAPGPCTPSRTRPSPCCPSRRSRPCPTPALSCPAPSLGAYRVTTSRSRAQLASPAVASRRRSGTSSMTRVTTAPPATPSSTPAKNSWDAWCCVLATSTADNEIGATVDWNDAGDGTVWVAQVHESASLLVRLPLVWIEYVEVSPAFATTDSVTAPRCRWTSTRCPPPASAAARSGRRRPGRWARPMPSTAAGTAQPTWTPAGPVPSPEPGTRRSAPGPAGG